MARLHPQPRLPIRRRPSALALLPFLFLGGACDTGPIEVYQARIDTESPSLSVPAAVTEDVPFTVVIPIRVCPGNEITARVTIDQNVEIEPYIVEHAGFDCLLADQVLFEVEATWPHPGPFILFIVGRDLDGTPLVLRYEVNGS